MPDLKLQDDGKDGSVDGALYVFMQVPATTHYSMVFYFVAPRVPQPGSLLQRFVDGDDSFRNSRLKLIPSVPKVLDCWILICSVVCFSCSELFSLLLIAFPPRLDVKPLNPKPLFVL